MIEREIEKVIKDNYNKFPAILIEGPRQSGKTTLCKKMFPNKPYFSFEDIDIRDRVTEDPKSFLSSLKDGAVLDEIQKVPFLLSYLQGFIDLYDKTGLFVLTGSNNLLLMQAITQTLAGRIAIFKLMPFSLSEIYGITENSSKERIIISGFYPRLFVSNIDPMFYYQNYIETYVEKNFRDVLKIKNLGLFKIFLLALASRIGSILDLSSLSREIGITLKTANEWLSVLETSYICFRLYPYFENRTKRLIKSPKIYFTDTGLVCSILGIKSEEMLKNDKMLDNLFENLIISDYIKNNYNQNEYKNFYFYRTSNGVEVDLIIQESGKLIPVEIKSSTTFNSSWLKSINKFEKEYSDKVTNSLIIYSGSESFTLNGTEVKNYQAR